MLAKVYSLGTTLAFAKGTQPFLGWHVTLTYAFGYPGAHRGELPRQPFSAPALLIEVLPLAIVAGGFCSFSHAEEIFSTDLYSTQLVGKKGTETTTH